LEEVIIPNSQPIEQAADLLGTTADNLSSVTSGAPISPVLADSISQRVMIVCTISNTIPIRIPSKTPAYYI
jgi:hypothetical protein